MPKCWIVSDTYYITPVNGPGFRVQRDLLVSAAHLCVSQEVRFLKRVTAGSTDRQGSLRPAC